ISAKAGNVVEMKKFDNHCAAAATASAQARIEFGNISPSSTHTNGPQLTPKAMTKTFAHTSAIVDQGAASSAVELPSSAVTIVALANATAIRPSETTMPAEPASSIGRRPTRSTSRIATIVTTMFVTEVITVIVSASDSSKPTERHSVVE